MIQKKNNEKQYYIDSYGPDTEAAKKAFIWLVSQPTIEGYIGVMSKGTFKEAVVYSEAMGDNIVKKLSKNNEAIVNNKRIILAYRPYIKYKRQYPIVVYYPNKKFLDMIDSLQPSSIFVVPWIENELDYWINKYNAIEIK